MSAVPKENKISPRRHENYWLLTARTISTRPEEASPPSPEPPPPALGLPAHAETGALQNVRLEGSFHHRWRSGQTETQGGLGECRDVPPRLCKRKLRPEKLRLRHVGPRKRLLLRPRLLLRLLLSCICTQLRGRMDTEACMSESVRGAERDVLFFFFPRVGTTRYAPWERSRAGSLRHDPPAKIAADVQHLRSDI